MHFVFPNRRNQQRFQPLGCRAIDNIVNMFAQAYNTAIIITNDIASQELGLLSSLYIITNYPAQHHALMSHLQ